MSSISTCMCRNESSFSVLVVFSDVILEVAYIENQEGTRSHVLCNVAIQVLHFSDRFNILAGTLFRGRQPDLTKWTHNFIIFQAICRVCNRHHFHLFDTSLNN